MNNDNNEMNSAMAHIFNILDIYIVIDNNTEREKKDVDFLLLVSTSHFRTNLDIIC